MNSIDGFFSIIYSDEEKLLIISDKVRSYPLFFTKKNNMLYVSDNAHVLKKKLEINKQNNFGVLEFLLCGYVTGNDTLYNEIKQLLPGQMLQWSRKEKKIKIIDYYKFYPNPEDMSERDKFNYDRKKNELREILNKSFLRLKKHIIDNNFVPVIPLSGGIDSRLIAIMLKKVDIKNAICYTYGEKNHIEAKKSREIAEKLDFEWKFVSYTKEKWNKIYNCEIKKDYAFFADGLSVKPHFMDFIAVKELFSDIDEKLIFLPGHTLDFISGKQIPSKIFLNNIFTPYELYNEIINKHYSFHYIYKKDNKKIIENIKRTVKKTKNKHEMLAKFDYWNWRERQSKFILNSLNVYDYFGFEWYIPFWEKEFQKFFLSIPYEYRFKRYFLLKCLNNYFPEFYVKPNKNITDYRKFLKNFFTTKLESIEKKIGFSLNAYSSTKNKLTETHFTNYGLNRYGAFDTKSIDIVDFSKKYKNSDVKKIFYFFTLNHLNNLELNLESLDDYYLKNE